MKDENSISANAKSLHVLSEIVVVGAISAYFYKKMADLTFQLEELKTQVALNREFIEQHRPTVQVQTQHSSPTTFRQSRTADVADNTVLNLSGCIRETTCKDSVCRLEDRKVVISKISEQIEFEPDELGNGPSTTKDVKNRVSTFSVPCSPNQLLQSVTPSLDGAPTDEEVQQILRAIDNDV